MKKDKRLIESPQPSEKPASPFGVVRIVDRSPPPDFEDFKAARSAGFKAARAALDRRRKP